MRVEISEPQGTAKEIIFVERPDGTRIHTVVAGRGPAVLLAHGYLLEHGIFDRVFDDLTARGYRVIAFDQRGHGKSTVGTQGASRDACASDYRAVLEHFAVEDATLVAHSMGAFLAIAFCLREPEAALRRIERLVLISANAGAVAVGSLQNRMQLPLLKSGLIKPLWRMRATGIPLVKSLFGPTARPEQIESTRQMLLRQDLRVTMPVLQAMLEDDLYPRLGEIPFETIVLAGEYDRTAPLWHAQRLSTELPRAVRITLPNIGHMLTLEAPQAIVEAVIAPTIDSVRSPPTVQA